MQLPLPKDIQIIPGPGSDFSLKGPLGTLPVGLSRLDPKGWFAYSLADHTFRLQALVNTKQSRALGPTLMSYVRQQCQGVQFGYFVTLEVRGVGFRVHMEDNQCVFKLGYSHDSIIGLPDGIQAWCPSVTEICLFSCDYGHLTQFAAQVKALRPRDAYKPKGIFEKDEVFIGKPGKKR